MSAIDASFAILITLVDLSERKQAFKGEPEADERTQKVRRVLLEAVSTSEAISRTQQSVGYPLRLSTNVSRREPSNEL